MQNLLRVYAGGLASSFEAVCQIRQRTEQPRVSFADEARRHAGADKPAAASPVPQAALPEEQHLTPDKPANEEPTEAKAAARAAKAEAPVTPAQDGGEQ